MCCHGYASAVQDASPDEENGAERHANEGGVSVLRRVSTVGHANVCDALPWLRVCLAGRVSDVRRAHVSPTETDWET